MQWRHEARERERERECGVCVSVSVCVCVCVTVTCVDRGYSTVCYHKITGLISTVTRNARVRRYSIVSSRHVRSQPS